MRFHYIFLAGLLSACSLIAPGASDKLKNFSPLEADPSGIQAILALPDGIDVVEDGAVLSMTAAREDTGETAEGTFILAETIDDGRVVYQIAPKDVPRLQALQKKMKDWKATAPDATQGSLSIDMATCLNEIGLDNDSTFSVWLRTEVGQEPFPLIHQSDVDILLESLVTAQTCPT